VTVAWRPVGDSGNFEIEIALFGQAMLDGDPPRSRIDEESPARAGATVPPCSRRFWSSSAVRSLPARRRWG